eukprot:379639-Rhodomonas_salina.1
MTLKEVCARAAVFEAKQRPTVRCFAVAHALLAPADPRQHSRARCAPERPDAPCQAALARTTRTPEEFPAGSGRQDYNVLQRHRCSHPGVRAGATLRLSPLRPLRAHTGRHFG